MNGRDLETLAAQLDGHPNYRVLRRLDVAGEWPALEDADVSRAVVLDTETTGLDSATDKVIELALVKFEYSRATGEVGRVLGDYDGLEDPGVPIPPESTALHGITDEMVRGQRLDEAAVEALLDGVGIVIAHNAGFDRPFVERRLPGFASLAWGCSLREVPWESVGIGSAKLEYLAYRYGFFFDAHRAEIDCRAALEVLRRPFGETGGTALKVLLASAREPSLRIWATGSPFETKDVLKARGYRWEADRKVWYRDLGAAERDVELAWLKESVYRGKSAAVEVEAFDARTRYSGRAGTKQRVAL
jgi:DNA polymerase III subunit epsilon